MTCPHSAESGHGVHASITVSLVLLGGCGSPEPGLGSRCIPSSGAVAPSSVAWPPFSSSSFSSSSSLLGQRKQQGKALQEEGSSLLSPGGSPYAWLDLPLSPWAWRSPTLALHGPSSKSSPRSSTVPASTEVSSVMGAPSSSCTVPAYTSARTHSRASCRQSYGQIQPSEQGLTQST